MDYDPNAVAEQEYKSWQRSADKYIKNIAPMTATSGQVPILCEIGLIDGNSHVLEIGCGTGDVCIQLSEIAMRVVGTDFAENMIHIATDRFPKLEFKVANAEDVPYDDNEFDVVVCNYTAHHFARPLVVFEEARRVLKPGGRLAIIMPIQSEQKCFGSFFASASEELPPEDVPGGTLLYVDDPAVVGLMVKESGFTNIVSEKRIKPIKLEHIDLLLKTGWSIFGLDDQPQDVQNRIRTKTIQRAEPYKQADGSYDFPDVVIVVSGTK
ncbi:MAG: class I SAM-dependent methyltransferase [Proteobacteria bacterium]|nr:class I SAM-dependent methyltransferase [Pseudomonadota bacterium]